MNQRCSLLVLFAAVSTGMLASGCAVVSREAYDRALAKDPLFRQAGVNLSWLDIDAGRDRRDDQLRDALAPPHGERPVRQVHEEHHDLAPVVRVDGARRVQHRDAMVRGEPGARSDLALEPRGKGDAQPGRHACALHGSQQQGFGDPRHEVKARGARRGRTARQGRLRATLHRSRAAGRRGRRLRLSGSGEEVTGFKLPKISVVVTRDNVGQLDGFKALADHYGAQLRITRLRPSGRGVDSWHHLHPTAAQQRDLYRWLLSHGESVLTGDSFFHLNALGESLPGLNLCGAGRVVCLIDPIGDVYACPFVIHEQFKAGSVRDAGGFTSVWRESDLFTSLREPESAGACASCGSYDACQGGCMAAKFFTGLPLDGPDPECVTGHGAELLNARAAGGLNIIPKPAADHSRPVSLTRKPVRA